MNNGNMAPYDEEWDDDEFEEYDEEEEVYKCRVCGKEFTYEDGDDYILICDECTEDYDMDQIWTDFDLGVLSKEDLKTMDLEPYKYKE